MIEARLVLYLFQTAAQTAPSVQVRIQPDPSAKILQIVLSIAVGLLSVTTFLLGYRKRILERRASWYQKVVVDASLPLLFEFFRKAEAELMAAVSDCERNSQAVRKTLSNKVTSAITAFSAELITVKDFIAERMMVFDEARAAKLNASFLTLQDSVSECFEDCVVKKRRSREEMRDVLLDAQRQVLKLLYECEFKNF
jgi:hypothetical protein